MKPVAYDMSHRDIIAELVNKTVEGFWGSMSVENTVALRDRYYELNRAIANALEVQLVALVAEYTLDDELVRVYKGEDAVKLVKHELARKLAHELVESTRVPLTCVVSQFNRERRYRIVAPIICPVKVMG